MPVLDNPRHEAFAQALAKGKSATDAMKEAGLEPVEFGSHSGYYVYALVNPVTDMVFYVGKGKGLRAKSHLSSFRNGKMKAGRKKDVFIDLAASGLVPRVMVIADNLSEADAYEVEGSIIRVVGFKRLANVMPEYITPRKKARELLARVKPMSLWLSEVKKRSQADIELFIKVRSLLQENAGLKPIS